MPAGDDNDSAYFFVHLKAKNAKERSQIAQYIHIDQVIEEDVYATVNAYDLAALQAAQKEKIITSYPLDIDETRPQSPDNEYEFPSEDEAYHTYDEMLKLANDLATRFPNIVKISSLGKSVEGRDITLIHITHAENRNSDFFIPGILFVGSHHAREHLATEVPLLLAKHITENYASDPELKKFVDTRNIYIIPLLNPDGKLYDIKGRRYKMWRKNRAPNTGKTRQMGVDLNRNYAFGWGGGGASKNPYSDIYMGPAPFSEPESLAMKNFIEATPNIRILLSYHTFSELILYPWGHIHGHIGGVDQQIFEKMANDMSEWNGYTPQKSSDLYIASGDTCDWAYGTHNIYCFTFELTPKSSWMNTWSGSGFYPGSKVIESTVNANIGPALYLMEYSDDPSRILHPKKH